MLWFALAVACNGGPAVNYDGWVMEQYWPMDGLRDWTYSSQDGAIPYKVVGTLNPEGTSIEEGTAAVHDIDFVTECIGTAECTPGPFRVRKIQVSSSRNKGIRLHGVDEETAGMVTYDPPITLAGGTSLVDETFVTETDGKTFTATVLGKEACPVILTEEWDSCVHITLDDGGAASPLAGDYWLVTTYGLAAFHWTNDPVNSTSQPLLWRLLDTTYEEE